MMNDSYVEYLVKRKTQPGLLFVRFLLITLAVATGVMGILGYVVFLFMAIIFGLGAYLLYINTELEYEYLYLSKELNVDKIKAKSKRKRVLSVDLQRLEILAPENSHRLDSYRNRQMKTFKFDSNMPDAKPYVLIYNGEGSTTRIFIEPNEEILKCIQSVAPRKVFRD